MILSTTTPDTSHMAVTRTGRLSKTPNSQSARRPFPVTPPNTIANPIRGRNPITPAAHSNTPKKRRSNYSMQNDVSARLNRWKQKSVASSLASPKVAPGLSRSDRFRRRPDTSQMEVTPTGALPMTPNKSSRPPLSKTPNNESARLPIPVTPPNAIARPIRGRNPITPAAHSNTPKKQRSRYSMQKDVSARLNRLKQKSVPSSLASPKDAPGPSQSDRFRRQSQVLQSPPQSGGIITLFHKSRLSRKFPNRHNKKQTSHAVLLIHLHMSLYSTDSAWFMRKKPMPLGFQSLDTINNSRIRNRLSQLKMIPVFPTPGELPAADPSNLNSGLMQIQAQENAQFRCDLISATYSTINRPARPDKHPLFQAPMRKDYGYVPGRLMYQSPVGPTNIIVPNIEHVNDFFSSLVDWIPNSRDPHGLVVMGHGDSLSLLYPSTLDKDTLDWRASEPLVKHVSAGITSVQGSADLGLIGLGHRNGMCQVIHTETLSQEREIDLSIIGCIDQICCLKWIPNTPHLLTIGTGTGALVISDTRSRRIALHVKNAHKGPLCGLALNSNGIHLASGSYDSTVKVWDIRNMGERISCSMGWMGGCPAGVIDQVYFGTKAAVKAMAWCPWTSSTLAVGGGSADSTVVVWDVGNSKTPKYRLGAQGQVTGLHWSCISKELVASVGFNNSGPSTTGFRLWNVDCNFEIAGNVSLPEAEGQPRRPLHMAWSPCGQVSMTLDCAGRVLFWRLVDSPNVLRSFKSVDEYNMERSVVVHLDQGNAGEDSTHPVWPTRLSVPPESVVDEVLKANTTTTIMRHRSRWSLEREKKRQMAMRFR